MSKVYLEPTQESGQALFTRSINGPVTMLNLLRLRTSADYSANPELAESETITGRQALQKYIDHTLPFLGESGGKLTFLGSGGSYFIGPPNEYWDVVMMIRQNSLRDFLAFASNDAYLAGLGHRVAAIQDSRLLPLIECSSL